MIKWHILLENSLSSQCWFWLHQPNPEEPSQPQTPAGTITRSRPAAHKASLKSATTVFNAPLQTFSIQSIQDANHAQPITYSTTPLSNATAKSHANFQDNSMLITSVNVHPIKRDPEKSGMNQTRPATALQTYHSGTVNIALLAQLELNSILKKSNAITAQTDSSEIWPATPVSRDFDQQIYRFIVLFLTFFTFSINISLLLLVPKTYSNHIFKANYVAKTFQKNGLNI